ncbi:hypothetical protein P3342_002890 [Pyrenophora teres f. teres]|nr:hypothetical protein P3342_002890 [Pyrenophora teres f. teres]
METHNHSSTEHSDSPASESEAKPELDPTLAKSIMSYIESSGEAGDSNYGGYAGAAAFEE